MTRYVLGLAVGAVMLAPLSDIYGRNNVYRSTWFLFALLQIPVALSRDIKLLLIGRFLGGLMGSPATTVVAGSLRDMWIGLAAAFRLCGVLF